MDNVLVCMRIFNLNFDSSVLWLYRLFCVFELLSSNVIWQEYDVEIYTQSVHRTRITYIQYMHRDKAARTELINPMAICVDNY